MMPRMMGLCNTDRACLLGVESCRNLNYEFLPQWTPAYMLLPSLSVKYSLGRSDLIAGPVKRQKGLNLFRIGYLREILAWSACVLRFASPEYLTMSFFCSFRLAVPPNTNSVPTSERYLARGSEAACHLGTLYYGA